MTADEVDGGGARRRAWLEERDLASVLAVRATQPLWAAGALGPAEVPAGQLVAGLPARAWRRLGAGDGPRGPGSLTGPRPGPPLGRLVSAHDLVLVAQAALAAVRAQAAPTARAGKGGG